MVNQIAKPFSISSSGDLKRFFDLRQNEAEILCRNIVKDEFDILEFNLLLSSLSKKKLDDSTRKVRELRRSIDKGKVDLSKYEDVFENY